MCRLTFSPHVPCPFESRLKNGALRPLSLAGLSLIPQGLLSGPAFSRSQCSDLDFSTCSFQSLHAPLIPTGFLDCSQEPRRSVSSYHRHSLPVLDTPPRSHTRKQAPRLSLPGFKETQLTRRGLTPRTQRRFGSTRHMASIVGGIPNSPLAQAQKASPQTIRSLGILSIQVIALHYQPPYDRDVVVRQKCKRVSSDTHFVSVNLRIIQPPKRRPITGLDGINHSNDLLPLSV